MPSKIDLMNGHERRFYTLFLAAVALLFVLATLHLEFNPISALLSSSEAFRVITTKFLPPNIKNPVSVGQGILVTICFALSATFLAGIFALTAALFGSHKVSPFPKNSWGIRAVATFLRNIPDLVWAFILFSALGIGTGVGFMALLITTFAFMTRAFIESIDEASTESTEGLLVVGSIFPQRIFQSILPSCMQDFISWFLYCIEVNIRASTIVGMVGGGSIGLVLFSYLKAFKYSQAAGVIFIVAALIISVDFLTGYLRKIVMRIS